MTNADKRHLEFHKNMRIKTLDLAKRALREGNTFIARHSYRLYQRSTQEIKRIENSN